MKRILLLLVAVFTVSIASAQNFKNLIKGAVTEIVDNVTDGKATEIMLAGTWDYSSPAIRLAKEGDTLSNMASSALTAGLEGKLTKAYNLVGIKQGASSFTFNDDNTFTAVMGKRTLSGTYSYDSATHKLSLEFSTLLKLGKLNGYAYISGDTLELVFDCSRLMDLLTALGSKSSTLKSITALVVNYDTMMIGFGYTK